MVCINKAQLKASNKLKVSFKYL